MGLRDRLGWEKWRVSLSGLKEALKMLVKELWKAPSLSPSSNHFPLRMLGSTDSKILTPSLREAIGL